MRCSILILVPVRGIPDRPAHDCDTCRSYTKGINQEAEKENQEEKKQKREFPAGDLRSYEVARSAKIPRVGMSEAALSLI